MSNTKKKICWLVKKIEKEKIKAIRSIEYFYCERKTGARDQTSVSFYSKNKPDNEFDIINRIFIHPTCFSAPPVDPLNKLNPKWFINTTSQHIPSNISCLLQLGGGFSLLFSKNKDKLIIEFIKDIECNLHSLKVNTRQRIRNLLIPQLESFVDRPFRFSHGQTINGYIQKYHKF